MMISTKGRYALRVMIDLAEHDTGAFLPLKDIAARQGISRKYLESIVSVLSKADFITGISGKGGGYRLSRPPENYTAGSIITLVESSLAPVSCLECEANTCPRAADCRTLPLWTKLDELIRTYLESQTLADLMKKEQPEPTAEKDIKLH